MADFVTEDGSSQDRHDGTPEPGSANKIGCGILGRYPVISILAFAIVGLICGKFVEFHLSVHVIKSF